MMLLSVLFHEGVELSRGVEHERFIATRAEHPTFSTDVPRSTVVCPEADLKPFHLVFPLCYWAFHMCVLLVLVVLWYMRSSEPWYVRDLLLPCLSPA